MHHLYTLISTLTLLHHGSTSLLPVASQYNSALSASPLISNPSPSPSSSTLSPPATNFSRSTYTNTTLLYLSSFQLLASTPDPGFANKSTPKQGFPKSTFKVSDYASTHPEATCTFPAIGPNNIGPDNSAPLASNVAQPCNPPTYQLTLVSWASLVSFSMNISHTIESGTPLRTSLKRGTYTINRLAEPTQSFEISSRAFDAELELAPEGWVGDAVVRD